MSVLSNNSIMARCIHNPFVPVQPPRLVTPFHPENVQPCSYDLCVDGNFYLEPMQFKLLSTIERVNLPDNIQGQVYGRSSIGRRGVFIHISAGFIDAGFRGTITLETFNASKEVFFVEHGTRVAQIAFYYLDYSAKPAYQGRYQDQEGVTPSRL